MAEVSLFAVLHDDLHFFFIFFEVVLINFDQVGVCEFLHEFDLKEGLFDLEGIDFDLFQCEGLALFVAHQEDAAETALADHVQRLVGLHLLI